MQKRIIISKSLVLGLVVLIILLSISYLAYLNHNDFVRAMISRTQQDLLLIAKSEAQSLQKYISDIDQELEILSFERTIVESLMQKDKRGSSGKYYDFLDNSYKDLKRLVNGICLIDSQGRIIAASPRGIGLVGQDLSGEPDVGEMFLNQEAFTSRVFNLSSGKKVIANLHPIFNNGKFIGLLRAVILIEKINDLTKHLNQEEKSYSLVIDGSGKLLSYPDIKYLGKNILDIINEKVPDSGLSESKVIVNKMIAGEEGTDIVKFLSAGTKARIITTLIAFTPIQISNLKWSIGIAMDYNVLLAPINTNARDNIIFASFVLLVLSVLGILLYRIQKKRFQSETVASTLDIINKQLRLEIEERKRLERELENSLSRPKKQSH